MSTRAVLLARPARHVWLPKAAGELVDREVDWTARMAAGDELEQSAFDLPAGLVADRASNTAQIATVRILGGVAGHAYEIVNRVTTRQGRKLEQTIKLRVR